jgi:hypothetical protein
VRTIESSSSHVSRRKQSRSASRSIEQRQSATPTASNITDSATRSAEPPWVASGSAHCLTAADAAGLAFAEAEGPGSTLLGVSAERDELRRLIEQLPDDRVQAVLAEARRQSGSVPAGEWPPSWFGSFASGRPDLGSNHDDLLAEGFGRS